MVCFIAGKEKLSLWLHYQIMICIFAVEMNSNEWNVEEICRTKLTSVRLLSAVMASYLLCSERKCIILLLLLLMHVSLTLDPV